MDPWFIVSAAPDEARLIRAAREVNDSKPEWVIEKVKLALVDYQAENPMKTAEDAVIACFGLTFKPDIDDLRESPALAITRRLVSEHSGPVWAVEPNVHELPASSNQLISLKTVDEAINHADVLVMLVDHKEFKEIKPLSIISKRVIDTRGIWK